MISTQKTGAGEEVNLFYMSLVTTEVTSFKVNKEESVWYKEKAFHWRGYQSTERSHLESLWSLCVGRGLGTRQNAAARSCLGPDVRIHLGPQESRYPSALRPHRRLPARFQTNHGRVIESQQILCLWYGNYLKRASSSFLLSPSTPECLTRLYCHKC